MNVDGDQFVECGLGHRHWGKYGAAGLLLHHGDMVLLQQRSALSMGPGTWGLFGGACARDEPPVVTALREAAEESTVDVRTVRVRGVLREDHKGWHYDTVVADVESLPEVLPVSWESMDARWVPSGQVADMDLFDPFAHSWPKVRDAMRRPVLIVDTANVMGSRADGWWRDRHGAATRLRDQLDALDGLPLPPFDVAYPEIVMIVEGKAGGVGDSERVRVVSAPGEGDDTIVDTVREYAGEPEAEVFVVTADRELKRRSQEAGASILGPRWLLDQLSR
ncbi:NUDIX hydrolase [Actinophytocola oryzae]|uniref:ADP-ribose pyrophosphatase YjhB (NUDIX family) n=1 Tax=Actinophytocola oryzae TaxID=502181 RepID=A0A4R7VZU2_9PSEU|nr:NUDIX hydrolase [Actinophytocola oryzae]TDV55305.1 ADP-ribose pyrophosphatase YjhB (NUDIX family) [Actinophytocola oryzae]